MARGNFVGGVEMETSYAFIGGALTNASLNARLGFALRDAILIYGETGFGVYLAVPIVSAGGGIEYAFANNNLSLFTEAKALFAIGGAYGGTQIRAGLNYGDRRLLMSTFAPQQKRPCFGGVFLVGLLHRALQMPKQPVRRIAVSDHADGLLIVPDRGARTIADNRIDRPGVETEPRQQLLQFVAIALG